MVKRRFVHFCKLVFLTLVVVACQTNSKDEVLMFVASGLCPVVNNVKVSPEFGMLVTNAASSGVLAKQIEAGADADLYFSANYKWISHLQSISLIDSLAVKKVAKNKLVVIVPQGAGDSLVSVCLDALLSKASVIAMGNPNYVPVGEYTKTALENLQVYDKYKEKYLQAKDVMSALKLVEMGEADLGFVYKTVAMQSDKVSVVVNINDTLCEPIQFYVVPLTDKGVGLLNNGRFMKKFEQELEAAGFE